MKNIDTLSVSNFRILRNGKILTPRKKTTIKKSSILKKNVNHLSILKNSPTNHKDVYDMTLIDKSHSDGKILTSNFTSFINNNELFILVKNIPPSINYENSFVDHCSKNCYINIEDYIQLNEVQIYNVIQPKIEKNLELFKIKKTKKTILPSNSFNETNSFIEKTNNRSLPNKSLNIHMTRGKTIELQSEQRKQLDQVMFNKFPNNTFKMFAIQLYDITKEVEFLRTLGLTCRFKCPLSNCKQRRK